MEYVVKRSQRRSVGIKITKEGEVVVCCPKKFALVEIDKIVEEKKDWINRTLVKINAELEKHKQYYNLEKICIFGKEYDIVRENGYIKIGDNQIKCKTNNIKKAIKEWLVKRANSFILSRLEQISAITGIKYSYAKIIPAKRNWGSCNNHKEIHLNYKLMMLPPICTDYVCVHELSHIKYMNHSKNFWETVDNILPNRKEVEKLMKDYSFVLDIM